MCLKDADRMVNGVDPDQIAPLELCPWKCIVYLKSSTLAPQLLIDFFFLIHLKENSFLLMFSPISNKLPTGQQSLTWVQHAQKVKYGLYGPLWPNVEHLWDFIPTQVICEFHKDPIKNERHYVLSNVI